MAHINLKPYPVHFLNDLPAHSGNAGVITFIAASRKQTLIVIGKLHEARTKLIADLNQGNVVLDWRWVLESKENSRALPLKGKINIRSTSARSDEIAELLKVVIQL